MFAISPIIKTSVCFLSYLTLALRCGFQVNVTKGVDKRVRGAGSHKAKFMHDGKVQRAMDMKMGIGFPFAVARASKGSVLR